MINVVKEINNFKLNNMKKIFNTSKAPSPLGPYNQAVMAGNMFFTSGQIAINSKSGELVLNNIKDETQQVMENLKAVLNTAELDFSNVVKTSIFITLSLIHI